MNYIEESGEIDIEFFNELIKLMSNRYSNIKREIPIFHSNNENAPNVIIYSMNKNGDIVPIDQLK